MNNFKPVYWLHDNIKLPKTEVEEVISGLKKTNFRLEIKPDTGTISSYHQMFYSRPDYIWKDVYSKIAEDITKSIGIYNSVYYENEFWSQLYYKKGSIHLPHQHNSGNSCISYVHFVKPTKDRCFNFLDNDGNDHAIPEQNEGDLICFPSYMWHRVLNISDEERFVVAGNILIKYQSDDYEFCDK